MFNPFQAEMERGGAFVFVTRFARYRGRRGRGSVLPQGRRFVVSWSLPWGKTS